MGNHKVSFKGEGKKKEDKTIFLDLEIVGFPFLIKMG